MKRINLLWWGLSLLAVALILFVSFYFDSTAQAWIGRHQTSEIKSFMHGVSRIGDWPAHFLLGLSLLALAYWRKSKKWMRIFAAMTIACALAGAGTRVIKIAVGRARPDVKTQTEWWNGAQFNSRYNAFPSGHTAASTAFFATLALASWRIGLAFMIIPLLIAFSRMYLAAHYLSDVVFAFIIGMLTAFIVVTRWIMPAIRNPKSEI